MFLSQLGVQGEAQVEGAPRRRSCPRRVQVRIPAADRPIRARVSRSRNCRRPCWVQGADGKWIGAGRMAGDVLVKALTVEEAERGPLRSRFLVRYEFDGGKVVQYTLTAVEASPAS